MATHDQFESGLPPLNPLSPIDNYIYNRFIADLERVEGLEDLQRDWASRRPREIIYVPPPIEQPLERTTNIPLVFSVLGAAAYAVYRNRFK